jgi:superfamily II DNA helicase RecQ
MYEFDAALREASEALANLTADIEPEAPVKKQAGVDVIPYDEALFERLKQWRLGRAKADNVSAFIIAHNTLLEELARRKPQTAQALLGVKGFGQSKLDKYGDEILQILTS